MKPFFGILCGVALVAGLGCSHPGTSDEERRPYLAAALKAADWLQTTGVTMPVGKAWPADPGDPKSVATDLYYGSAGIILFYLQLYQATEAPAHLQEALAGAEYLVSVQPKAIEKPDQAGFYTGVAGEGFVLEELYKATKEPKYHRAALRCVDLLQRAARPAGSGIEWNETTDIIGGGAGIGLFLLYAAREMGRPEATTLAAQAGRRLLDLGIPEHGGLKWRMDPTFPRLMPNFSHGTSGVCFFLASLHAATGEAAFLEGALAGVRYLRAISQREGRIFHHEPGGEDLFYQGWCHGPAGTARLYYALGKTTGESQWTRSLDAAITEILESGIPEHRTPGFWNNVSQCCGSAGVAEFFVTLYRLRGKPEYLAFARRLAADLSARATPEGRGWKWIQAEHRVKPELLVPQTGYMQGAAGMGICFLHLDAAEHGGGKGISLPDDPF